MFGEIPIGIWVVGVAILIAYIEAYNNPIGGVFTTLMLMPVAAIAGAWGGFELAGGGGLGVLGGVAGLGIGYYGVPLAAAKGAARGLGQ
jgi:hypothetical protein